MDQVKIAVQVPLASAVGAGRASYGACVVTLGDVEVASLSAGARDMLVRGQRTKDGAIEPATFDRQWNGGTIRGEVLDVADTEVTTVLRALEARAVAALEAERVHAKEKSEAEAERYVERVGDIIAAERAPDEAWHGEDHMSYELSGLYSERLVPLVGACGLNPIGEDEARRRQDEGHDERPRGAWHECGHMLVALLEGIDCDYVELHADGTGRLAHRRPPHPDAVRPRLHARIALAVAGAVAEEVVFGDVAPPGVWTDLATATARARGRHGDVRVEVARVRAMLARAPRAGRSRARAVRRRQTDPGGLRRHRAPPHRARAALRVGHPSRRAAPRARGAGRDRSHHGEPEVERMVTTCPPSTAPPLSPASTRSRRVQAPPSSP